MLLCLQKYVGFPDLIPSSPHRMSSMFASDQTSAATTRASEPSSQRVSHITRPQFYSISLELALQSHGIISFVYRTVVVLHNFFSLQHVGPPSWLMMWEVILLPRTILTHIPTISSAAGSLWHKSHVREKHFPPFFFVIYVLHKYTY